MSGSRTLKLTIEYDGTDFFGWQVQPDRRTVAGELERAFEQITRVPTRVHGASRTDAGVHALGQVAHVVTASPLEPRALQRSLNAVLPEDVSVTSLDEAPEGFDARRDASGKTYRYRIVNRVARSPLERRRALFVHEPLDVAAMHAAAQAVVGEHDFRGFETEATLRRRERTEQGLDTDRASVRRIGAVRVARLGGPDAHAGLVALDVCGNGFLYNMVRTLAGTLLQVGRGKRPGSDLEAVVAAQERARAGPTAPAAGLCLVRVFYGEEASLPALA